MARCRAHACRSSTSAVVDVDSSSRPWSAQDNPLPAPAEAMIWSNSRQALRSVHRRSGRRTLTPSGRKGRRRGRKGGKPITATCRSTSGTSTSDVGRVPLFGPLRGAGPKRKARPTSATQTARGAVSFRQDATSGVCKGDSQRASVFESQDKRSTDQCGDITARGNVDRSFDSMQARDR